MQWKKFFKTFIVTYISIQLFILITLVILDWNFGLDNIINEYLDSDGQIPIFLVALLISIIILSIKNYKNVNLFLNSQVKYLKNLNWKELFKPTLVKLILTLLLFVIVNGVYCFNGGWEIQGCPIPNGFPIPFYYEDVNCVNSMGGSKLVGYESTNEFHAIELLIDLIAYYLITLIGIVIYKKTKTYYINFNK